MRHLVLFGLCILLIAGCTPPSPKPDKAGATGGKDTDRPGGNYHSFELPSAIANPTLCDSACKKDPKCKSWSYVKPVEGKQARCNLKSNVPPAVPDVCCFSGVKPGADKPKVVAKPKPDTNRMSKADIRRERRKLERDHKMKLKEFENELKKVDRQFESRKAALEKKKARSGGSDTGLQPLQKQVSDLSTQKEAKNKELETLQAQLAQQREEIKRREQELKSKSREYQTFARGVDSKIAKVKSQMEKAKAAASSKTSALAKEEKRIAEEEAAAKAELEAKQKAAEAEYAKMIADLEKAAAAPEPTPTPTPKPTPAKVAGGVEVDTDRPGGDYRIIVLDEPSPRVCRSACQGEGQCKAWTYVKPKVLGNKARCFLKNSVPAKEKSNCCVSGVKS